LTQKKLPPAPNRTDIYDKIGKLLNFPRTELAKLADLQRREALKRQLTDPAAPLFQEVRELILSKCKSVKRPVIQAIFEKQPFGELERFVTQKLLDVVKSVAKQELESEQWLRRMARLSHRSYEQMRVIVLEFLDTTIFDLSRESCVSFLEPLLESWDIDLMTFGMEILLNHRVALEHQKKFEFIERDTDVLTAEEQGFTEFLRDPALSGGASSEEIEFLKKLRFKKKKPTPLYYYRELQNLRDPLHFRTRYQKDIL
jgi:hypothetical protein